MILSGNILQEISSKDTSISTINKIYKEIVEKYESESIILDFGCGKYDRNKEFAEKMDSDGMELIHSIGQKSITSFLETQ